MIVREQSPVVVTLQPSNHPYLNGAWTPQHTEVDATDLDVIEGAIPADLDGIYLRNSQNPAQQPLGIYFPFDGDGMIHQVDFRRGRADYRNRFVRTRGFQAEQEARHSLWRGLCDRGRDMSERPGVGPFDLLKDASSTDIKVHAGKALSMFYLCGEGYRLDPNTLETLGIEGWVPIDGLSAHSRVDENTGELMFFNYSNRAPHMHYGVVDKHNRVLTYFPVQLPGPRMPHDMAFTEHWSILNDLPLFTDAEAVARKSRKMTMHWDVPSRFALVPRRGPADGIRWFEAAPTYVQHWVNAYEDGDEVILDGYFQEDPLPKPPEGTSGGLGNMLATIDLHLVKSRLQRWRFNLATGMTREERLDDRILEFGTFNQRHAGKKYRFAYSCTFEPGWFLFKGWVKHDLQTGKSWEFKLPPGVYCSESPFAPRLGAVEEDDGYVVSFLIDENTKTSECWVLDAKRIQDGPIARVALPHKISSGTHSCWAGRELLGAR
ncbi:MAG: apocarotenoid-15,15'-oxygenase [Deltaproteobacteria bacterium]|nr:apocarotenoid-15,15'-oxygenase [Deltaproteobacteria bacterium]